MPLRPSAKLFVPEVSVGTDQEDALHDFDGETYEPDKDRVRLNRQLRIVFDKVIDGNWWSLAELETATGEPQASISARLRDLRKKRFGSYTVERRRRSPGTFEYRIPKTVGHVETDVTNVPG